MQLINLEYGELLVMQSLLENMIKKKPASIDSFDDLMVSVALQSALVKVKEAIEKDEAESWKPFSGIQDNSPPNFSDNLQSTATPEPRKAHSVENVNQNIPLNVIAVKDKFHGVTEGLRMIFATIATPPITGKINSY